MRNLPLARSALALLSLLPLSAAIATPTERSIEHRFDGVTAPEVRAWRDQPGTVAIRPFHHDSAALSKRTAPISIDLGVGQALDVTPVQARRSEDGMLIWEGVLTEFARLGKQGDVVFDPMNSVTLVDDKGRITGTVRINGQLFKIRPLRGGGSVAIEVDERQIPSDHPNTDIPDGPLAAALANGDLKPSAQEKANKTIRVMTVATQSAINASGGISALVNLAITEANQSYSNSGIAITLQAAGLYSTSYSESGSFSTDLARIRGTSDGYLDSVHSLRNSNAADVVMFVIDNSSSCGLASAIGASSSTAFAAVHWDCATGYYSFGHEIGHLQAARHDPANDPSTSPYAFGHGYQQTSRGWRTVMAYNCSPSCTRINYWSNPDKTYGGVAMGTDATHDNARVLNLTAGTIAGFR